jgi:hypothetical protein
MLRSRGDSAKCSSQLRVGAWLCIQYLLRPLLNVLINIADSYILYIQLRRIRSLSILESTGSIANARSPRLTLICHHYVAL